MFPLKSSAELVFGGDKILDDLIVDNSLMKSKFICFSSSSNDGHTRNLGLSSRKRQRQTDQSSSHPWNTRKIMHRAMERKRRQQLSELYVSLRSLLPLDDIKGKRSVCDQLEQAVNHVKQMQNNIQELRIQRDKLKKLNNSSNITVEGSNDDHSDNLPACVTVNLVSDGLEILISRSTKSSDLGLSGVFAELLEKELDVVSCVTSRTKWGFLHKIKIQARDTKNLDVSMLRYRLTNAM